MTALLTRPDRRQVVQTDNRRGAPFTMPRTRCKFGRKRRRVFTAEWLTEWPVAGRLPQMSHCLANTNLLNYGIKG